LKVTLKIPLPNNQETVMEADGKPEEIAAFLKLWLLTSSKSKGDIV